MKTDNRRLKARRGSSTVLVILMIVMLVSLSVLSVSISNSGLRLSYRMGEQFKEFFIMESEADRCYAEMLKIGTQNVTADILAELGCEGVVDDEYISFYVRSKISGSGVVSEDGSDTGRRFHVVLRRDNGEIVTWAEAERYFEIVVPQVN